MIAVETDQADAMLCQNKSLVLLDVRTLHEYLQVRLAGAILSPIDQLLAREKEVPTTRPRLDYCTASIHSSKVAEYLAGRG